MHIRRPFDLPGQISEVVSGEVIVYFSIVLHRCFYINKKIG